MSPRSIDPLPDFPYIPRLYLHFNRPIGIEAAKKVATNPESVARHGFLPFIRYTIRTEKIKKKPGGGFERKLKDRPIDYADHVSTHIFAYYAGMLSVLYEAALLERGLPQCITAFRSLGKSNIHFANDVFEEIKKRGECFVLATDIRDFFNQLNHKLLKEAWCRLLNVTRLPADHFAVFEAITRYCRVDRDKLFSLLGINPDNPREDGRQRICTPCEFRNIVRSSGLCVTNRSGNGIPQGSPISALLANLYMLEFDSVMNAFVTSHGGTYRRYCDDVLLILPSAELRTQALLLIRDQLDALGLEAHPEKTEEIDFSKNGNRVVASKTLNYLGFTFDGLHKRIRPASIARYYQKVRRGIGRAKAMRYRVYQRTGIWTPLKKKALYRLYSYLGHRNFLTYGFRAAKIMKDTGINKQVKRHWPKLQALIQEGNK